MTISPGSTSTVGMVSALPCSDVVDRVVDRELRAPARQLLERGGVWLAPAELLEAVFVGLVEGDVGELRTSIRSAR